MAYEKKDGDGVLFKNNKEGGNPNWPDYKGQILINGQEYWLSAWIKEGAKGKFMSIAAKPKEARQEQPRQPQRQQSKAPASIADMDDDIPF